MSTDSIERIGRHLKLIEVRPVAINFESAFDSDNEDLIRAREGMAPSFSRFRWTCVGQAKGEPLKLNESSEDVKGFTTSFLMNTWMTLAMQTPGHTIPEDEDIPEGITIAKIEAKFTLNYFSEIDPDTFDEDAVGAFVKYNLPYHLWPYWRELAQNTCTRSRLPLPVLPPLMLPKENR